MHGDHQSSDLFARLIAAATAYPRDLFPPLSEEVRSRFPDLIGAASAEMARSLGPLLAEAGKLALGHLRRRRLWLEDRRLQVAAELVRPLAFSGSTAAA